MISRLVFKSSSRLESWGSGCECVVLSAIGASVCRRRESVGIERCVCVRVKIPFTLSDLWEERGRVEGKGEVSSERHSWIPDFKPGSASCNCWRSQACSASRVDCNSFSREEGEMGGQTCDVIFRDSRLWYAKPSFDMEIVVC